VRCRRSPSASTGACSTHSVSDGSRWPDAMTRLGWLANRGEILTRDFLPGLTPYVGWLKTPLGSLGSAAVASLLCGLFLHPHGFVMFFGLVVVTGLGVAWPWLSMRGLSGSLEFDRARSREGESITARIT